MQDADVFKDCNDIDVEETALTEVMFSLEGGKFWVDLKGKMIEELVKTVVVFGVVPAEIDFDIVAAVEKLEKLVVEGEKEEDEVIETVEVAVTEIEGTLEK